MTSKLKSLAFIGLISVLQPGWSSEITDAYNTGDTLTKGTLDNIKSAVNDNNSRIDTMRTERECQTVFGGEMVKVGPLCVDKYEASVFNPGSLVQYGLTSDDYPCIDSGGTCVSQIYAISWPNQIPSSYITWHQAQQACRNVNKRLPTSAEWMMVSAGTPDPSLTNNLGECNADQVHPVKVATGTLPDCVSDGGVHDMVGNVWEWVADLDTTGLPPPNPTSTMFLHGRAHGSGYLSAFPDEVTATGALLILDNNGGNNRLGTTRADLGFRCVRDP